MTIIKFDSIVEVSFVIHALNECSTKRGRHNISNGTRTLASHTDHPQWRFHVYPPFPLSPPLYTINFIDQMQLPVSYCVYIVKLHAVRDPPPFSAQKCIFFYLCCCLFILPSFPCISWQMHRNADLPWSLRVRAACVFVCVCEAWLSVLVGWTGKRPSRWARLLLPACWRSCTCLLESALSRSPHAGLPSPVFT